MRPGQVSREFRLAVFALAAAAAAPGGAAAAPGEPYSYRGSCKLVVDGTTYFDIQKTCPIYAFNSEPDTLIVNSDGESELGEYFAYLNLKEDGTAIGSWNAQKGAPNASVVLGEDFTLKDGCWSNARATICAHK